MAVDQLLLSLALAASPAASEATETRQQFENWERRLRSKVAELHTLPAGSKKGANGDVVVRFSIGADGRPAGAVIQQSSGNPVYDRAALRVVRYLGPIGRVPSIGGHDHPVVLKLSFGDAVDASADRSITRELEAERKVHAQRNLAVVTKDGPVHVAGRRAGN